MKTLKEHLIKIFLKFSCEHCIRLLLHCILVRADRVFSYSLVITSLPFEQLQVKKILPSDILFEIIHISISTY